MLFNSYTFLFLFLPLTLAGFLVLSRLAERRWAEYWLILCSLVFYSWFDVRNTPIILGSVLFNYSCARSIARLVNGGASRAATLVFTGGVAVNIAVLCYYKYTDFFLCEVLGLFGLSFAPKGIELPLGISFFTFQQIIFLKDIRSRAVSDFTFTKYLFCVTFFPHLIAGPIIKYKNILTQLYSRAFFTFSPVYASAGVTWLLLGLFKKVLVADSLAPYAGKAFGLAAQGGGLTPLDAWIGSLAYTFQIYFDFSGYSDMAIGLGLLFKIELPVNFNSPYKATSIVDFWRRWHITLSWFLRECIYIPLGGNRRGRAAQYANLMVTMLLGGMWHGAGWTFLIWGGMHGLGLVVTHAWTALRGDVTPSALGRIWRVAGTFAFVSLAWVPFRADGAAAMAVFYKSMFGLSPVSPALPGFGLEVAALLAACAAAAWFMPNTQEIMSRFQPCVEQYLSGRPAGRLQAVMTWRPGAAMALLAAAVLVLIVVNLGNNTEFLYFQF